MGNPGRARPSAIAGIGMVVGVIAIAALTAGCGDDGTAQAASQEAALRASDVALCAKQVEPLHVALTNVHSDLQVGLNFTAYAEGVRSVARAYNRVDIDQVSALSTKLMTEAAATSDSTCLGAMVSFENAYNAYNRANSTWSNCIDNISAYGDCTGGSVGDSVQAQWTKASSAIANGERRLARDVAAQKKAQTASAGA